MPTSTVNNCILFIDDDNALQKTVSLFLEANGFHVTHVPGVRPAITFLEKSAEGVAVILSDVRMPDGSGVELLDHVQSMGFPIPVVLFTGYASLDLALESIRKRAFDLIQKPPDFSNLLQSMERACHYSHLLRLEKRYMSELEEQVALKTAQLHKEQIRLAALASELSTAEERERRRIATELHDQIGQTLVFSKIKLAGIDSPALPDTVRRDLKSVLLSLEGAISGVRMLTTQISPPLLYDVGLVAALESLAENFSSVHGISYSVLTITEPDWIDEDSRAMLYQAVRELFTNIAKHSAATRASVSVLSADKVLTIRVEDNGTGFDTGLSTTGFGLFNIRKRLQGYGGGIEINSSQDNGTLVTLNLPLRREEQCCES